MKFAFAIAATMLAGTAQAQSTATSHNEVASTSSAQNAGNAQSINFNSDASGTLKNTPGVVLGGFAGSFSSDYCRGSTQAGISGPGFAIGGGTAVTDDACVLYRGVERTMQVSSTLRGFSPTQSARLDQAAIDMLCSVPQLSPALRNQGVCTLPEPEQRRAHTSIYSGGQ